MKIYIIFIIIFINLIFCIHCDNAKTVTEFYEDGEEVQIGESVPFLLHQNYPNPFNPVTKIKYTLPNSSYVTLKVFDLLGREIRLLVDGIEHAGNHEVVFDASSEDYSSGIYFYVLHAGDYFQTNKMLLLK